MNQRRFLGAKMLFKAEKQGIFLINLFVINKLHQPRQMIDDQMIDDPDDR